MIDGLFKERPMYSKYDFVELIGAQCHSYSLISSKHVYRNQKPIISIQTFWGEIHVGSRANSNARTNNQSPLREPMSLRTLPSISLKRVKRDWNWSSPVMIISANELVYK